jgi:hypothetical protein
MNIYKIIRYENMLMKNELSGVSVLASETGLFDRNFAEQVLMSDCGAMLNQQVHRTLRFVTVLEK